jgi:hypothetical protein
MTRRRFKSRQALGGGHVVIPNTECVVYHVSIYFVVPRLETQENGDIYGIV